MSNISTRRKEGSRTNISGVGNHDEFLKRITKTLYYGQLPTLPCLSLPVTELSCEVWSAAARGRSLRRLRAAAAARLARGACVSPCALVLALVYMERLRAHNLRYVRDTPPHHLFLVSLMVGTKFLQDDGEDEEVLCSEWATSGGLELNELKKLEIDFLDAIDWNVYVNEQSFEWQLSWLECEVAERQARARGFYTYSELRAARAQAGALRAALCAAAAAALACVALLGAAAGAAALLAPAPPAPPAAHNHTLRSAAPYTLPPSAPLPAAAPLPAPPPASLLFPLPPTALLDAAQEDDVRVGSRLHVNFHQPAESIVIKEERYNATPLQWNGTGQGPRALWCGGCPRRRAPPPVAPPPAWSDR